MSADRATLIAVQRLRDLLWGVERRFPRSATMSASRRRQISPSTFTNEVALELGKRAKDVKDQLACTGRRVNVLGQAAEANSPFMKRRNSLDEMLQGTAEPIQPPGDQSIALAQVEQRVVQSSRVSAARTAVKTAVKSQNRGQTTQKRTPSSTAQVRMKSSFWRGRWDRNRTCNLRFWSARRTIQSRLKVSKLPLNRRIMSSDRPGASKNVQPVCSQFCSQCNLRPSAGRRCFMNWNATLRLIITSDRSF